MAMPFLWAESALSLNTKDVQNKRENNAEEREII